MSVFIYSVRNRLDGKGYIGQAVNPQRRWAQHVAYSKHSARPSVLAKAMWTVGVEQFAFEPMMEFDTQDEANEAEIFMIRACGTQDPEKGFNVTSGGGFKPLAEDARKRSATANTGKKRTPLQLVQISKASKAVWDRSLSDGARVRPFPGGAPQRTHCARGHTYAEGAYKNGKWRSCRSCSLEYSRERRKFYCRYGHSLADAIPAVRGSRRYCRTCKEERRTGGKVLPVRVNLR